ncbi:hypothetical protein Goarm_019245, partial [Gossypium armourianum]|nr:hypothetical protein [Gossypium armourianum]
MGAACLWNRYVSNALAWRCWLVLRLSNSHKSWDFGQWRLRGIPW